MTTAGFGGEGPVVVPMFVPALADDERAKRERAIAEAQAEASVEDASPDEIEEEAEVVAHLDDPEVDAAIDHLRATRD